MDAQIQRIDRLLQDLAATSPCCSTPVLDLNHELNVVCRNCDSVVLVSDRKIQPRGR